MARVKVAAKPRICIEDGVAMALMQGWPCSETSVKERCKMACVCKALYRNAMCALPGRLNDGPMRMDASNRSACTWLARRAAQLEGSLIIQDFSGLSFSCVSSLLPNARITELTLSDTRNGVWLPHACLSPSIVHLSVTAERFLVSASDLTSLKRLELIGIDDISFDVAQLTALNALSIFESRIPCLPYGVTALTGLTTLMCGDCSRLTSLPDGLVNLTALRQLMFRELRMTSLPQGISALTNLERFDVIDSDVEALPHGIGALTGLTRMCCSGTNLAELPDDIALLTSLKDLDVSQTDIEALPQGIGALTSLRFMCCANTSLAWLPDDFVLLTALEDLNLRNTDIVALPQGIGALTSLTFMCCANTRLAELPEDFMLLTALKHLDFSHSELEALPHGIGALSNLETLDCDNTYLSMLPNDITALQTTKLIVPTDAVMEWARLQLPGIIMD